MFASGVPVIAILIFLILIVAALSFLAYFMVPALRLERALADVIEKVVAVRATGSSDLKACFSGDDQIASLWKEYSETLHVQKAFNPSTGGMVITAVRSTVPAEVYLSPQAIVDGRIHAEFFKHLPGIFTGIGIIGTFGGLLNGLSGFEISDNPATAQASLSELLRGVSEAFVVSATAIFLAMLCTVLEKYLLNSLYGKVARIAHEVDGAYESGAGEEYLARLVSSSEESASQTRILKDALVSDLKEILTDLAERQIAANRDSTASLGPEIADALNGALKGPLEQIAGSVSRVSEEQSGAVTSLLTDVLASFSQKLETMFGSQLSGINDMQQRTIETMQAAVAKLQDLIGNVESAGTRATDEMSKTLVDAMKAVETRQAALNDELRNVLTEIRAGTGQMQSETQAKLEDMLSQLSQRMGEAIAAIEQQSADRNRIQQLADDERAKATQGYVGKMGDAVTDLKTDIESFIASVSAMTSGIEEITRNAFMRLNGGADTLLSAADRFEVAGRRAADSFDQIATISSELSGAAGNVAGAARSLDSILSDYKAARDSVASMVESLRGTVEAASREAALTEDVLKRIEGAAKKLADAQQDVDGFLDEVVSVIADSHQKFADGMRSTVIEANRQFHTELSQATGLLKESIQELEFALPAGQRPKA